MEVYEIRKQQEQYSQWIRIVIINSHDFTLNLNKHSPLKDYNQFHFPLFLFCFTNEIIRMINPFFQ